MKKKLIIILILVSSVPLLISSGLFYYYYDDMVKNHFNETGLSKLNNARANIDGVIAANIRELRLLAGCHDIRSLEPETLKPFLAHSTALFSQISTLTMVDDKGDMIARNDSRTLPNVKERQYFQEIMQGKEYAVSELVVGWATSKPMIILAVPVYDNQDNRLRGSLQSGLFIDVFNSYVKTLSQGSGLVYVLDKNGRVLAHPNPAVAASRQEMKGLDFVRRGLGGEQGIGEYVDNDLRKRLVYYMREETTGWLVCYEVPYDDFMAAENQIRYTVLLILLFCGVLAGGLGIFMSNVVVKPITAIVNTAEKITKGNLTERMAGNSIDEIGVLADKFNEMTENLVNMIHERDCACMEASSVNEALQAMNEELTAVNEVLQHEIDMRVKTEEKLSESNQELTQTISELKTMQSCLVQSEKMAALGGLVAGVAHEINTPVGLCVTLASHLQELTKGLDALFQSGSIRRADLEDYIRENNEATRGLLLNAERAATLVSHFKQVSADQASQARRTFNVREYINEILTMVAVRYEKSGHTVNVRCDPDWIIDSYPGAFAQILTNLILNSLVHAYGPGEKGQILIEAERDGDRMVIAYKDDGRGIDSEDLKKIFDPFFTTRRNRGNTGLGLAIVYNLVTQLFKGEIECTSQPGNGTAFRILIPVRTMN